MKKKRWKKTALNASENLIHYLPSTMKRFDEEMFHAFTNSKKIMTVFLNDCLIFEGKNEHRWGHADQAMLN